MLKLDVSRLFLAVSKPKIEIKEFIEQLRILKTIDPKSYRQKKTNLPYVVPGLFNPQFRKTENFNSIQHLILDLDHITDYDFEIAELKEKLKEDETVELMFVSPSSDGLKIFFKLAQPCFDHKKFSLFYQSFAKHFAQKHNVNQIVDFTTSDVTRACFISVDLEAYFNPNPETVVIDKFIDFNNIFEIKDLEHEIKIIKKENIQVIEKEDIDKDIFVEIKKKLNPNIKLREERKKHIYVPEKLDEIIAESKIFAEKFELNIDEIINIHYGKKFIFSHKHHTAEINVFYGRRGFSVVRSPKSGTNLELMEIGFKVFSEFLAGYQKL
ncbi:MAG: virulence protein E [Bacteroidales bacterium]|nr:virulence protein E [Bacteroidales bacterium]